MLQKLHPNPFFLFQSCDQIMIFAIKVTSGVMLLKQLSVKQSRCGKTGWGWMYYNSFSPQFGTYTFLFTVQKFSRSLKNLWLLIQFLPPLIYIVCVITIYWRYHMTLATWGRRQRVATWWTRTTGVFERPVSTQINFLLILTWLQSYV